MYQAPDVTPPLRPLGIGEVLDRAVTICVRNFVPLALIYVVLAIPLGIVQYFTTHKMTEIFSSTLVATQARKAAGLPPDPLLMLHKLSAADIASSFIWLFIVGFLFAPLPLAALIESACAHYLERPIDFVRAYRLGLGRWLPLIGLNVVYLLVGLTLYLVLTIVALVVALGIAALYGVSHPIGIAIGVIVGGAFVLAAIAFLVLIVLAIQISYFTLVFENTPVVRAFVAGIERVFARREIGRSLLFGAAWFAIGIGLTIVAGVGGGVLMALSHTDVVVEIFGVVLRVAVTVFTTLFIAIFYFDLRVREEGFDLQLAAQAEGATLAR